MLQKAGAMFIHVSQKWCSASFHCQLSEAFALTDFFVFVAVFSFVMQRHNFRLTTLYKYPQETGDDVHLSLFWNKGLS